MKQNTLFKNPGPVRDTSPLRRQSSIKADLAAESDAANIQAQVQHLYDEQHQMISDPSLQQDSYSDSGNIEQEYKDAIDVVVAEKETQAENLENRLESQIDKQEFVLQQMMNRQPGFLSLPGQKAKWQSQVQQQQARLSRLQNRLETVKEIHDGMGLHGPRIHALATDRVRHEKPELAKGWDEMRTVQRTHENLMRRLAKEQKEKLQKEQLQKEPSPSLGKSNGLSLTRTII